MWRLHIDIASSSASSFFFFLFFFSFFFLFFFFRCEFAWESGRESMAEKGLDIYQHNVPYICTYIQHAYNIHTYIDSPSKSVGEGKKKRRKKENTSPDKCPAPDMY